MATTTEILTNILELDPGMQLPRNLGDKLLFIPRIKDRPSNKADPTNRHDGSGHTCRQAPGQDQLQTAGVCTENCRSPMQHQEVGMLEVEVSV